jgi:hypothetical protein
MQEEDVLLSRVARWYIFIPKLPIFCIFGEALLL